MYRAVMQATAAGRTFVTEMNETSMVKMSGCQGSDSGARYLALTPSITCTLGSARSRASSCPRPTSSAMTRAAPRWSRQSTKPPVEAPTSSAERPATSIPNVSSAASSFSPARETNRGRSLRARAAPESTRVPALSPTCPPTSTNPAMIRARAAVRLGARPRENTSSSRRMRAPRGTVAAYEADASEATASEPTVSEATASGATGCRLADQPLRRIGDGFRGKTHVAAKQVERALADKCVGQAETRQLGGTASQQT